MKTLERITLRHTVQQVVRVDMGGNLVTLRHLSQPRFNVVTIGMQGPVGTVAESVLTMAQQAVQTANSASDKASQVSQDQLVMVSGMSQTIDHYIGAIGAQE
ncbi:hypothetical protein [Shewanella baltica]|uniref:hypothetical protein n=1 Tax=Shewanella baltica TaxID=62322 RepID=UPI00217DD132|nr:hypothetical protein [Shewanella baltica]MCS6257471.1 hypothetical protein [Shewanella baltica]MCS6272667.1 hypothetical protein [Shewanella baltica]